MTANKSVALEQQLVTKFGLKQDPFALNENFFFGGGQRQHNLDTMQHLVSFGDMVLLLTGDRGAGKTAMLQALITALGDSLRMLRLSGKDLAGETEFISRLSGHLGQSLTAKVTLSGLLRRCDEECEKSGRVVVAIDDAHRLPKDLLHVLIDAFRRRGQGGVVGPNGVVLCLIGEPALVAQVTSEGVDPEKCQWLYQIPLKPFSEGEVVAYIESRFVAAGFASQLSLTAQQLNMLMSSGKGNPGRINRIAIPVLLDRAVTDKKRDAVSALTSRFMFGLALLLLLSFIVIAYQYDFFGSPSTVVESPAPKLEASSLEQQLAQAEAAHAVASDVNAVLSALDADALPSEAVEPVMTDVPAAPDESSARKGNDAGQSAAIVSTAEHAAPDQAESVTLVQAPVSVKAAVPPVSKTPAQLPASPEKPRAASSSNADTLPRPGRADAWVKAQPNDHYTMQVLGSHNEATARKFIAAHAGKPLYYCEARRKNQPWFIVLYSRFASKELALAELDKMPATLKKQQPWIRSFESIKDTLP